MIVSCSDSKYKVGVILKFTSVIMKKRIMFKRSKRVELLLFGHLETVHCQMS